MPNVKKQVAVIIIEGATEEIAIKTQIEEFLDGKGYIPLFCKLDDQYSDEGGDITSRNDVTPENLDRMISRFLISPRLKKSSLDEKDIGCVIQITDTDGAFVSDECICQVKQLHPGIGTEYETNRILALNKHNILLRNKHKSDNLKALVEKETIDIYRFTQHQLEQDDLPDQGIPQGLEEMYPDVPVIKSVPYCLFYFSCNLDHYIDHTHVYNPADKIRRAYLFAEKEAIDFDMFRSYVNMDPDTVKNMSYQDSWAYIMDGCNSLHRHTNIHLLFDMNF